MIQNFHTASVDTEYLLSQISKRFNACARHASEEARETLEIVLQELDGFWGAIDCDEGIMRGAVLNLAIGQFLTDDIGLTGRQLFLADPDVARVHAAINGDSEYDRFFGLSLLYLYAQAARNTMQPDIRLHQVALAEDLRLIKAIEQAWEKGAIICDLDKIYPTECAALARAPESPLAERFRSTLGKADAPAQAGSKLRGAPHLRVVGP